MRLPSVTPRLKLRQTWAISPCWGGRCIRCGGRISPCMRKKNTVQMASREQRFISGSSTGEVALKPRRTGSKSPCRWFRLTVIYTSVMIALRRQKTLQATYQLAAGPFWDNPNNLVFTNETGRCLTQDSVRRRFKAVVSAIGRPELRFHDLRHFFAVASLENGDDIKTVQQNLGHASAGFTLDVYGHVSEKMRTQSAQRMEHFIESVSAK